MEEEESEEPTLASLPIIRTELRVLTSRTTKFNNQMRTQKKLIISLLGAQDNRITELSEKNQVLQTRINTLTSKNKQQEEQIASITSQVHLLTNQVDFLLATLRQVQPGQEQPVEEQVDNSAQE